MTEKHKEIQHWVKEHYHDRPYRVAAEEIDGTNYLPVRQRHCYQPDVILRDVSGEIKYIIEVENDPVRKALIGASILADYCVGELRQQARPRLIFVVYAEVGIKQIPNFKEKLKIAIHYCRYLEKIEIYSEADFKALPL